MSNWDTHEKQREARIKWIEENQSRITELSELVVGAMDEKTLMELATEIVESGWADYPEGFEYEWKQYQKGNKKLWY
tara:strand:+ start:218 stop:448 length:231 start_codon:yes stop_codon:yes gene_type:complete